MPDTPQPMPPPQPAVLPPGALPPPTGRGWLFPLVRVLLVIVAGFMAWYVAGNWNRWTGEARYETTDDAYMVGDVTPLAAKVYGYVEAVLVDDYQTVKKGDLLVQIEGSDYRAQLAQAEANLAGCAGDAGQPWQPEGRPARADPPGRGDDPGDHGGSAALRAGGAAPADAVADEDRRHRAERRTGRRQPESHRGATAAEQRRSSISRKPCSTAWTSRSGS